MADKPLVDVKAEYRASESEVEQFRITRVAEKVFLAGLSALVSELLAKVGPQNGMVQSMNRFMRSRR